MPEATTDEKWMRHALNLARHAWGQTHPNPLVGAVIVESGEAVAEGWHRADGGPHAEVEALRALGRAPAKNATLYVTLEPCSTCGRTGACTDAILAAGIRRVVIGADDPNPAHAGQGVDVLRAAGIEVVAGVLAADCADLNLIFGHWITRGEALLAAKIATTADGAFGPPGGSGTPWVTGLKARADVMHWRQYFPAIGVSANTALADDPRLTVRLEGAAETSPRRFIFDRELKTAGALDRLKLYTDAHAEQTVVVCTEGLEEAATFKARGITLWELPHPEGRLDWGAFRKRCGAERIYGVYLEPGPTLSAGLLAQGEVDYLFHYIAPIAATDQRHDSQTGPYTLREMRESRHGKDRLQRGWL
jgi:diaminohydroxyphosphoribosylaminopyrimidine deaminase/5-amino-6-(5-phosphoribosylamino)uracil reductase